MDVNKLKHLQELLEQLKKELELTHQDDKSRGGTTGHRSGSRLTTTRQMLLIVNHLAQEAFWS